MGRLNIISLRVLGDWVFSLQAEEEEEEVIDGFFGCGGCCGIGEELEQDVYGDGGSQHQLHRLAAAEE
jgi:hypothetical protein